MSRGKLRSIAVLLALAAVAGCARENKDEGAAVAQPAAASVTPGAQSYALEASDSLRAFAKLTLDSAVRLALTRVPNGAIEKVRLERENGAVVFSFDIRVPGRTGISEVNVDAATGAVSPTEHEDAAAEGREAREDSAAARRPPATKRP